MRLVVPALVHGTAVRLACDLEHRQLRRYGSTRHRCGAYSIALARWLSEPVLCAPLAAPGNRA